MAWTVFILLLIALAVVSWFGSFYIFGHPEEPFSYRVLKTLGKIEPLKRFEITAAPRGEFLGPQQLFDRYSVLPSKDLLETNRTLLRSYIRNYDTTKDAVPYVMGGYTVLDSFELGENDFFPQGIVALARSKEDPRVLLELLFPAPPERIPSLHRMLLTGLDLNLQRRLDLSAVIHVEKIRDGRIKLTAVPIIYGTYASSAGQGTISLEPPAFLNVPAGLPILRGAKIDAAEEKYAAFRRKSGLEEESGEGDTEESVRLVRVQRPEGVSAEANPDILSARPAEAVSVEAPLPQEIPVLPALPVEETQALPALPAQAVLPQALEETPLTPTPPPAAAAAPGRNWEVFPPGKMPRGRLVPVGEVPQLASRGTDGERIYLEGSFVVTASSQERAVLRSRNAVAGVFGGKAANVRIIADFPAGSQPPIEGASISRDALRPFLVTGIEKTEDGQINVRVREITTP